jgi:hypothetical protein
METKICSKCKLEINISNFSKNTKKKDGLQSECKMCQKEYREININSRKQYYNENKEKLLSYNKIYYRNNSNELNQSNKLYRIKNKNEIAIKEKIHKQNNIKIRNENYNKIILTDTIFKLKESVRKSIQQSFKLKNKIKISKTQDILGCSFGEFKIHIESQFTSWMDWGNYGKYNGEKNFGWDIDHRVPLSSAKTEEDIVRLNHYTNLQPLCSYINRVVKKDNLF